MSGKLQDVKFNQGDFVFVLPDAATSSQSVNGPERSAVSPDTTAWAAIQNSEDPLDFQTFIKTFPDSPIAPFAEARLKALSGTEIASLPPAQAPIEQQKPSPQLDKLFKYPLTFLQKIEYRDKLFDEIKIADIRSHTKTYSYPYEIAFMNGVPLEYKTSASSFFQELLYKIVDYYGESHAKYSGYYDIKVSFSSGLAALRGQQLDTIFLTLIAPGWCGSGGCTTHIVFNNGDRWYEIGEQ